MSHIEAKPDAIDGVIQEIDENSLYKYLQAGDLVICRLNAPLITLCLKLIAKGINARFKGDDLENELVKIIEDISDVKGFHINQFGKSLSNYQKDRESKLDSKTEKSKTQALKDKLEAIRQCYQSLEEINSIDDVGKTMRQLFCKDSKEGWVDLSSVHKAKGLEANCVFILHPDKLPLERAGQQNWEKQQEQHLHYMALTRAKQEIWFVKAGK